ncbi:energy-coupling factor transporter transmembrane component T [Ruminococcus sp. HUN007]|uniref:energy-coupling factor transporter transmembrane component T n=1 Tax=Ruminococcus sp. HUN007 TaxID=1514668 RepID=UPI0005D26CEC|nr:energy-coupling factor transporter transmembrane component T [Ruminococcus sp. HUN007]
MKLKLDPRTKLLMIFVVSAVVMMSAVSPFLWVVRIIITMIPIMLLISEKHYAAAFRFLILYVAALLISFKFLSENSKGFLSAFLVGYCSIIVQFMPAMITAWYVVKTTKIGEFVSAMQKMHVPDGITISLAVVMRFFPTIKEEYSAIRDAMKMRGIMLGGGNAASMVEYRMIPLLFSCVNIGDELSAAALTRGLGGKEKRTSAQVLKIGAADYIFILLFMTALAVFVVFKYIK